MPEPEARPDHRIDGLHRREPRRRLVRRRPRGAPARSARRRAVAPRLDRRPGAPPRGRACRSRIACDADRDRRRSPLGLPPRDARRVLVATRRPDDRHDQLQRHREPRRGLPRDRVRSVRQRRHVVGVRVQGPRAARVRAARAEQPLRGHEGGGDALLPLHRAEPAARIWRRLRLYSVFGPWEEPTRLLAHAASCAVCAASCRRSCRRTIARDYVYVDDAVEAFILAAKTPADDLGAGLQRRHRRADDAWASWSRSSASSSHIDAEPAWGSMPERRMGHRRLGLRSVRDPCRSLGWKPAFELERRACATFASWLTSDTETVRHRYETHRTPPQ